MNNARRIFWVGATALLFGCTAGTKATTGSAGTSGTGSGGMTGTAGTSGGGTMGTAGTGPGFDAGFDLSGADHPGDGVCSASSTPAEPVPLDLYVLMDSSLSMNETTSTGTKWGDVRIAMKGFFESQSSAGLGVGLKYFPGVQSGAMPTCSADGPDATNCGAYGPCDKRKTCVGNSASTTNVLPLCGVTGGVTCNATTEACALVQQCGTAPNVSYCAKGGTAAASACTGCTAFDGYCHLRDRCDAAFYATPDVAVGTLDGTTGGQAATLNASLLGHSPAGYTPTGPALTGALTFARQRIASMPTHRVAIVLVTDGLPGGFLTGVPPAECTPGDVDGIADLARGTMGATGAPPVNTFVIGVFAPGNAAATAQTNLDILAKAGQNSTTATAVVIDTGGNVATALQSALQSVQSKAIACDFKIPSTGVDFKQVNVQFTSGSNSVTTIPHAPPDGAGGCDARGGWYYDKDPATGTPTKITACPTTCSMFQTDLNGHVDVILGCPTIDVN